ncbi:MAG TPA: 2OG-Fe(II) oxygenase [Blastocatellia bacterium]|nr:2OG-Fe(II) oxygenase [Blastocatellia bacterium]
MRIAERIASLNWQQITTKLDEIGYATSEPLLNQSECQELIDLYKEPKPFRSRIDMARFQFGHGEYQYFADPLPPIVEDLRTNLYPHLAGIANRWMEVMSLPERFPDDLTHFLQECRRKGQPRPTPLLLFYKEGDYNCLHQDLYGEISFPLQAAFVLNKRAVDYTGGEFLLLEQRPRAQSRGEAINLEQGQMLIFPNRYRPVKGTKGYYRTTMRHGVSRVLSGNRSCLGIIFHNAK